MQRKIPLINPSVTFKNIRRAVRHSFDASLYEKTISLLSESTGSRFVFLSSSGIAAFLIVLKTIARLSQKKEVVLPAYTAGSLIVAIKQAKLKPVLCDVSLRDFNSDTSSLLAAVTSDTLAVVAVHSFGVGVNRLKELKRQLPEDVFVLEDCAQAMGTEVGGSKVGLSGDISFYSFNRGKNLPVYSGGCIATNSDRLAQEIIASSSLKGIDSDYAFSALGLMKNLAFKIAAYPRLYGFLYPLLKSFKENAPPRDIAVECLCSFQAALLIEALRNAPGVFEARRKNGKFLLAALGGCDWLLLPQIEDADCIVFNRLPVLVKDAGGVRKIKENLWRAGFESSEMYLLPLDQMFELGYKTEAFPNAAFVAKHLLTLPVHAGLTKSDCLRMAQVILETGT